MALRLPFLRYCLGPLWMMLALVILAGCAGESGTLSPARRMSDPTDRPWPARQVLVFAYHEVQDSEPDETFMSVSTDRLAEHFAWLRENGYQPVSIDQIEYARAMGTALPAKAVLLTFDDGFSSFHTRVLPLLKAFNWPAVLAVVGRWTDTPADEPVLFGTLKRPREQFMTWDDVRDVAQSGLVEIAAHTNDLHYGIPANPQGNTQPAAAVRRHDPATGAYETESQYRQRIAADAAAIARKIEAVTGKAPRVWVWPYGEASGVAIEEIKQTGFRLFMTLDWGLADIDRPENMPRLLISENPSVTEFARSAVAMEENSLTRALSVSLDTLYSADPAETEKRLGELVQYVADLHVNTIYLRPLSDPDGSGQATAAYFPNQHLPMRADLFNRVAWQLRTRAEVVVYAQMPVAGLQAANGTLSHEQTLEVISDLAGHSVFAGLLLEDPHGDWDWTAQQRGIEMLERARQVRGPQLKSAALLMPAALPGPAGTSNHEGPWVGMSKAFNRLVAAPESEPQLRALMASLDETARTDLVLATSSDARDPASRQIPQQLARYEALGARHLAVLVPTKPPGSDSNHVPRGADHASLPDLAVIRPALSNSWYPFP